MNRTLVLLSFLLLLVLSSFRAKNSTSILSIIHIDTIKKDTVGMDTIAINKVITAEDKYESKKRKYREIYLKGDNKKPIQINPFGGILISINKIYSHFSKEGKNARRLQKVFESEFEQDQVEALWKPLTVKLTPLKGDSLFYFQMYFLPKSSFLKNATYYEKVEYVVQSMRIYRDSAEIIHKKMRLPSVDDIVKRKSTD